MRYIFTISSLLLFIEGYAQNLVHNPSFEQNTACPTDTNQISLASEWFPAGAGADFFDSCSTNWVASVPLNYMGYQNAYMQGHAYAGIFTYKESIPNLRGYIRGSIDPLILQHWFRVQLHLCSSSQMEYSWNSIGVFFYINATIPQNNQVLSFEPQFDYVFQFGGDTSNWVTLDRIVYADSAYTKLLIGNFRDDASSNIHDNPFAFPQTPEAHAAYTYVDSISVVDITAAYIAGLETQPINVNAYPNPFSSYTNISIDAGPHQPYTLRLYNMQGALLRELNDIKGNNIILQREDLPSGFYYYRLFEKDIPIATGKIMAQ